MTHLLNNPSLWGVFVALIGGWFTLTTARQKNAADKQLAAAPEWNMFSSQQAGLIAHLQEQVKELQSEMKQMRDKIDALQAKQEQLARKYWAAIEHIRHIHREYPAVEESMNTPSLINPDL